MLVVERLVSRRCAADEASVAHDDFVDETLVAE
jgi:hypothetical protein